MEHEAGNTGVLKIYIHVSTGAIIAAREMSRKDGIIIVKHPAFSKMRDDRNGFEFEPFTYVAQTFNLYKEGCLGDTEMPEIMVPFFENYENKRESQLEALLGNKK